MDSQRIMFKIQELEHYLQEIQELSPESKEEFISSLRIRRSIERQLQIMIECVIDICILLIKGLKLNVPTDEDSLFDILKKHISNTNRLKEMKGFRNILVHRYGTIDNDKMYLFLTEEIDDFSVFITEVKEILKNQSMIK